MKRMNVLQKSIDMFCTLDSTFLTRDSPICRIIVNSRIVKVDLPSLAGRERVLRVHAKKLSGFTEGHGVDPSSEKRYDRNERERLITNESSENCTLNNPFVCDFFFIQLSRSLGRGKAVDLSAVAAATDGLSGAELESIVNEAAIYAVRRVSMQLSDGKDPTDVDHAVYPQDFEASVESFFESRGKAKQNNNPISFRLNDFSTLEQDPGKRWATLKNSIQ